LIMVVLIMVVPLRVGDLLVWACGSYVTTDAWPGVLWAVHTRVRCGIHLVAVDGARHLVAADVWPVEVVEVALVRVSCGCGGVTFAAVLDG